MAGELKPARCPDCGQKDFDSLHAWVEHQKQHLDKRLRRASEDAR